MLHANDDVTFMSSTGHVVRLRGSVIPSLSRIARGVRLVRMEEDAVVAGVTANDRDAIVEIKKRAIIPANLGASPEITSNPLADKSCRHRQQGRSAGYR